MEKEVCLKCKSDKLFKLSSYNDLIKDEFLAVLCLNCGDKISGHYSCAIARIDYLNKIKDKTIKDISTLKEDIKNG